VFLSSNSLESGWWTKSENPLILFITAQQQLFEGRFSFIFNTIQGIFNLGTRRMCVVRLLSGRFRPEDISSCPLDWRMFGTKGYAGIDDVENNTCLWGNKTWWSSPYPVAIGWWLTYPILPIISYNFHMGRWIRNFRGENFIGYCYLNILNELQLRFLTQNAT
jgi:hypothetical protein